MVELAGEPRLARAAPRFAAFLSYSSAYDSKLAKRIHDGLVMFGRRRRTQVTALRVYLDTSEMPASPDLRKQIIDSLDSSEYFVLLASRASARSKWVEAEALRWLDAKGTAKFLIALTDDSVDPNSWGTTSGRSMTHAIASSVLRGLETEPKIVDFTALREAHGDDPEFLDGIATLAAPIHGVEKYDLIGLHLSEQQRALRIRRTVIIALAGLLVVALAAGVLAVVQRNVAQDRERAAAARQLMAQAEPLIAENPQMALRLGEAAMHLHPGAETRSFLAELVRSTRYEGTLSGFDGRVQSLTYLADGHTLVTATNEGSAVLWDLADPARPRRGGQPLGPQITFSGSAVATGKRFSITGEHDGTATLWDVNDLSHPRRIAAPFTWSPTDFVAVTPNGRILAVGDTRGTVNLWDVTNPGRPRFTGRTAIHSQSLSPWSEFSLDGRTLLVGDAGETGMDVIDLTVVDHPRVLGSPLTGAVGRLSAAAFAPDGSLATADMDGHVTFWDLSDRNRPRPLGAPLTGLSADVVEIVFAPDGRTLATSYGDGTTLLWDLTDRTHPQRLGEPLVGHQQFVGGAAPIFAPDGRTLVTASEESVILWDLTESASARRRRDPITLDGKPVRSVAFGPGTHILAGGGDDSTVLLWDVDAPDRPRPLGTPVRETYDAMSLVAFAPDGRILATGGADGGPALWDVTDPGRPRRLGDSVGDSEEETYPVAFAPDGRILAVASQHDVPILWDISDPGRPRRLNQPDAAFGDWMSSVAYAPDGRVLVTGSSDFTATLWDVSDPAQPRRRGSPLSGHSNNVRAVVFTSDGHTLATASDDATVILWDVSDLDRPRRLGDPLTHAAAVRSLAFTPDGRTLAAGSADGTAVLWDLSDLNRPRRMGKPLTGRTQGLTPVAFAPDGHTLAVGSEDGTAQMWDVGGLLAARDDAPSQACLITGGGLDGDQWARYLPDLSHEDSCTPA